MLTQRREEKSALAHGRGRETFGSSFYVFLSPLGLPYVNWLARSVVCST